MELPQPRALGTGSSKVRKATHDFLSLYSSSTDQQDPIIPSQAVNYLKTHDFLQPLAIEKPAQSPSSIERILPLPGGLGTYGISYPNQSPALKSDHGTSVLAAAQTTFENSNSTSFRIWQESKGKTRKENAASDLLREEGNSNWPRSAATFGPFSSSHQPSSSQSFVADMVTSAKDDQEEEDDDEEFVIKKEPTSQSKGNWCLNGEAKTLDQKPNTPRSKHSATEQRRRSKINDRFQKLREIIPNSDRKRDKASFLFEVIEYIQFLQEKVNRYEGSYTVWNHDESSKMMMQWSNGHKADHARGPKSDPDIINMSLTTSKEMDHQPQTPAFSLGRTDTSPSSVSLKHTTDTDKTTTERGLTIESGTINISSVYSQGLLNSLTKALQTSGVDLSQARISVRIDLGKRLVSTKDVAETANLYQPVSAEEGFGQALKRLKTSLSN